MNAEKENYAFIKYLDVKHEPDFVDNGLIYMNTLDYFRKHPKSGTFGDVDEGVFKSLRAEDYEVYFKGIKLERVIDRIRIVHRALDNICLFCLTSINNEILTPEMKEYIPRSDFSHFGNHAVIIPANNWRTLVDRLTLGLDRLYKNKEIEYYMHGMVQYVPATHNKQLGPFRKFDNYKWQQEWRLIVQPTKCKGPFTGLRIGSMRDLVISVPIEEVMAGGFQVRVRD